MTINYTPRTWVTGELVTAAMMNTEVRDAFAGVQEAWTTYTVAWTAATTNPTLNNGTITGRYLRLGKTIIVRIDLNMGTTTALGSGVYSFSLPVAAAQTALGFVWLKPTAANESIGACVVAAGASTVQINRATGATTLNDFNQLSETGVAGSAWDVSINPRVLLEVVYEAA